MALGHQPSTPRIGVSARSDSVRRRAPITAMLPDSKPSLRGRCEVGDVTCGSGTGPRLGHGGWAVREQSESPELASLVAIEPTT